jgi:hypothetical protein
VLEKIDLIRPDLRLRYQHLQKHHVLGAWRTDSAAHCVSASDLHWRGGSGDLEILMFLLGNMGGLTLEVILPATMI